MVVYGKNEMEYISQKDLVMEQLVKRYGHLEKGMTTDVFTSLVPL